MATELTPGLKLLTLHKVGLDMEVMIRGMYMCVREREREKEGECV